MKTVDPADFHEEQCHIDQWLIFGLKSACTALDDPLVGSSGEARTDTLDGGRLRLIASPDVQYVTVRTGRGGQQRATEPLSNDAPAFDSATSPRIA